ncbi:MAG: hypothetical protein ACYC64_15390 [Armatimonadota bacterium]
MRRSIDVDTLCRDDPCDLVCALGSFWPNSRTSFESHVVKGFKECHPSVGFEPHISHLCEFYADLVMHNVGDRKFDWVVRVLSSAETEPDSARSQTLLVDMLCKRTGARDITNLFFKSGSRPSMRSVPHLSGPDSLKRRIHYVAQDMFIRPAHCRGNVLLIDDIFNTGASARVYAHALKNHGEVEAVHVVNLAATRFGRGKDGHGMLKLDLSGLDKYLGLSCTWLDSNSTYHASPHCSVIQSRPTCEMLFLARRKGEACPECVEADRLARKWWKIW